jgi:hypothetical protein
MLISLEITYVFLSTCYFGSSLILCTQTLHTMLGDLQRMRVYTTVLMDFQEPQPMPDEVSLLELVLWFR